MFELYLIGGGILLILIAIVISLLPGLSFIPIPLLGDVMDFAIAPFVGALGVVLIFLGLIMGGVINFISEFWWVIPLTLIVWLGFAWVIGAGKKMVRRVR